MTLNSTDNRGLLAFRKPSKGSLDEGWTIGDPKSEEKSKNKSKKRLGWSEHKISVKNEAVSALAIVLFRKDNLSWLFDSVGPLDLLFDLLFDPYIQKKAARLT